MEHIQWAAIQFDDKVYVGRNHSECIAVIFKQTGKRQADARERPVQGFVTNTGRFVEREEAGRIAITVGQIDDLKHHRTQLFSEDLLKDKQYGNT